MPAIPPFVLGKLYVKGSLRSDHDGFALELKNVIAPGTILDCVGLCVDGETVDLRQVALTSPSGDVRAMSGISEQTPLHFPVGATVVLRVALWPLPVGPHEIVVRVVADEVGPLDIPISDTSG